MRPPTSHDPWSIGTVTLAIVRDWLIDIPAPREKNVYKFVLGRNSIETATTRDELLGKYRSCASRVLKGDRLEKSIAALENLEKLATAKELMDTLTV